MLAVIFNNFGGPDVLSIKETADPSPGPEQLLVRVKACALNRADLLQRRGKYPPPPGESTILGLEIAGEVVKKGSKTSSEFNIGDRVFGLVGGGAYAEYCLIDHRVAMAIPKELSFIDAAAIAEAFLTASEALFTLGELKQNESVLIHAGGSGVGSAAIQLAKQIGAYIFTTVSSPEKMAKVKELGADVIINYKTTDFAAEIQNKQQIDVIIDFVGANYLERHLSILNTQGRLICVGLMGGTKTEINLEPILHKRLQIKGLRMRTRSLSDKRIFTEQFVQTWLPLFSTGKIRPMIDRIFSFHDAQKAHAYMESNANVGKIILTMD